MKDETELEIDITAAPEDVEVTIESEDDIASDDIDVSEQDQEEDTTTSDEKKPKKKSNKSNFKKLSEANKAKEKRIAELEAKLESQEWADDEDDEEEDEWPWYEKVDLLEFLTETEWAPALKDEIKQALEEFKGISFKKAFEYAKATWPQQSTSKRNFSSKSSEAPKTKKLKDLTREEAVNNLNVTQFDAWEKSQRKDSNVFG